jgi:hypothetical protein
MAPWFLDADNGVLLALRCIGQRVITSNRICEYALSSTADGGRTWRLGTLPTGVFRTVDDPAVPRLYALDNGALLLEDGETDRRWLTTDRGGGWQEQPAAVSGSVPAAPVGSVVLAGCPACRSAGLTLLRSAPIGASGSVTSTVVGMVPPAGLGPGDVASLLDGANGAVWWAADGSGWIVGSSVATGAWVARTDDGGARWQRTSFAVALQDGTAGEPQGVSTRDGRVVHVLIATPTGQALRRSEDGGRHWRSVAMPGEQSTGWTIVTLPDGGVLAVGGNNVEVLAPVPGARFEPLPNAPPLLAVVDAGGRYAGVAVARPNELWTSIDGRNWELLTVR